jgi:hypothetical protein
MICLNRTLAYQILDFEKCDYTVFFLNEGSTFGMVFIVKKRCIEIQPGDDYAFKLHFYPLILEGVEVRPQKITTNCKIWGHTVGF